MALFTSVKNYLEKRSTLIAVLLFDSSSWSVFGCRELEGAVEISGIDKRAISKKMPNLPIAKNCHL
jgi:hypothetical protein